MRTNSRTWVNRHRHRRSIIQPRNKGRLIADNNSNVSNANAIDELTLAGHPFSNPE